MSDNFEPCNHEPAQGAAQLHGVCIFCYRDRLGKVGDELTRLTAELAREKRIKCDSMSCLRYVGEAVTLFYENGRLMDERDRLSKELAKAREAISEAVKYLQEGKARFAPDTTNSFVDEFIEKWNEAADGRKEDGE